MFFLLLIAVFDSSMALIVDLMMDPLATIYNWWIWVDPDQTKIINGTVSSYNFHELTHITTPENWFHDFFKNYFSDSRYPTRWFGIPLINYISWFVFVLVFSFQFRWVEYKANWPNYKKTSMLLLLVAIDIPVLSYLLISANI